MQPHPLDKVIGSVTEHALLWRKETRDELAAILGMSSKSLARRIGGKVPWEAWEVKVMADHFGLPVQKFYDGPDGFFLTGTDTSPGYLEPTGAAA